MTDLQHAISLEVRDLVAQAEHLLHLARGEDLPTLDLARVLVGLDRVSADLEDLVGDLEALVSPEVLLAEGCRG
jgi:hypothetical protein